LCADCDEYSLCFEQECSLSGVVAGTNVQEKRRKRMTIGPLEYVVIGCERKQFTREILPTLNALHKNGAVRVLDLVFMSKDAAGNVATREVNELSAEEFAPYSGIASALLGMLTAEDVDHLAGSMSHDSSAVVVLLEHTWAIKLTNAVRRAGGVLFTGGLISPDAVAQVSAELAVAKEANHA
jgi:Family of unknown function (DUF6325)